MNRIDRHPFAEQDGKVRPSQRAKDRDSLFLMGQLVLADETRSRDVRVRNLSEDGLMIEMERPIALGSALTLTLRGIGDVAGRVAWCAEGRVGIALDHPIDPRLARKPVGSSGKVVPSYAKPLR